MPRIEVTPDIAIEESEIAFSFVRSSGPGGQNVNKVETAQLRFDVTRSASLDEALKRRLPRLGKVHQGGRAGDLRAIASLKGTEPARGARAFACFDSGCGGGKARALVPRNDPRSRP